MSDSRTFDAYRSDRYMERTGYDCRNRTPESQRPWVATTSWRHSTQLASWLQVRVMSGRLRTIRRQAARASILGGSLVGAAGALLITSATSAGAIAPRPVSYSYYIEKNVAPTNTDLTNWGCALGTRQGQTPGGLDVVAGLGFGSQLTTGNYSGWGSGGWTPAQVTGFVQSFAAGYAYCANASGDANSKVTIVIATNNSGASSTVSASYGQTFHQLVNNTSSSILPLSYGWRTLVVGGNDIEPGFSDYTHAQDWVNGYISTGGVALYSNASADGCPSSGGTPSGSTVCTGTWTVENVYAINNGNNTLIIPQIYRQAQAEQWYRLSAYGYATRNHKIRFAAEMTQRHSCHPVSRSGCTGLDWVADSGYDALQARLNADPNTTYTIPSATDVAHSQEAKAGTLPSDPASP